MIDPLKATKGRRMSKKTRKKSPQASSKKATRAASKPAAKRSATKPNRTTASKSAKKSVKKPANAPSPPSQKATSKKLSAPVPQKPAATTATPGKAALLTEGVKAPAFQLPRDGGNSVSLADYTKRKLVIFFYPRADTPGCTKEAIDFTRLSGDFADSQTAVLGVSADPLKAQEAFRDKHQLSTPLASDEKHEMLQAYGVWGEKSMYGKSFLGILRTTVLIAANGKIARIWRNVKVDGHADEVLAAARDL
jgi:thioredoxin-dependent peroxiredoxin